MAESRPLCERLFDAYLKCPLGNQDFLPLDVIDLEITERCVKAEARPGYIFNFRCPDFAPRVVQQAKKVFATLAIIGEPQAMTALFEEGITDDDLPLRRGEGGNGNNVLISDNGEKVFKSFAAWKESIRVRDFLNSQWTVLAPSLDYSGKNQVLDTKTALPFVGVNEVGGGHLSTVYKGEVHPAHQVGLPTSGEKVEVAVKEFRKERSFRQEQENLAKIQGIRHPHLIPHFATWERGALHYIIFPWANGGNLADCWQRMDSRKRTGEMTLWFLKQMRGIAEALHKLHKVNCRHGDLKPENILEFVGQSGDYGTLVIADVGVSRIHNQPTVLRPIGTSTRATTPAYEAPETLGDETAPRARRYDIWSLGCILLELVIWLMWDSKAVVEFREAREGPDYAFYLMRKDSQGRKRPEVHPVVLLTIDRIRKDIRCQPGTALEAVVSLVAEHLLVIDAESRDNADKVAEELGNIIGEAEKNPLYLSKSVNGAGDRICFKPRPSRKDSLMFQSLEDTICEEPFEV